MAYDDSNSGVLFVNRKRGDNDRAPNMKGNGRVTIKGIEYDLELAAWTRESETAGKFLTLSIKHHNFTAKENEKMSKYTEESAQVRNRERDWEQYDEWLGRRYERQMEEYDKWRNPEQSAGSHEAPSHK